MNDTTQVTVEDLEEDNLLVVLNEEQNWRKFLGLIIVSAIVAFMGIVFLVVFCICYRIPKDDEKGPDPDNIEMVQLNKGESN